MTDYAEHTVAIAQSLAEMSKHLREKRYAEAAKICALAMSHLAKLHAWCQRQEKEAA